LGADGGHFEQRSGSLNTILEVDHLRTIDDMFAILAYWFQRRRLMALRWSAFKIMSCDPDLHPRWSPSADIVLTWNPMGKMFKKNFL
jgi:hypothetical protein